MACIEDVIGKADRLGEQLADLQLQGTSLSVGTPAAEASMAQADHTSDQERHASVAVAAGASTAARADPLSMKGWTVAELLSACFGAASHEDKPPAAITAGHVAVELARRLERSVQREASARASLAASQSATDVEGLRRRVHELERRVFDAKGVDGGRTHGQDGLSPAGSITIIANALGFVTQALDQARHLLPSLVPGGQSEQLNGLMFVATVLLTSVLDSTAAVCQKLHPLPEQGDVYFHRYQFVSSKVAWVQGYQARIGSRRHNGKSFSQIANHLKHECPWVGSVGLWTIPADGSDSTQPPPTLGVFDKQGVCYLHGMLIPVYSDACSIIARLAKQHPATIPNLPVL